MEDMYIGVSYGCKGRHSVPPVSGESASWSMYHNASHNFCLAPSPGSWGEVAPCNWGATQVVINEINAHGTWSSDCDFVELFNRSNSPIDISGWQIICNNRHYIPSNTVIPARGYYILDQWLFPSGFGLSPACDNVYLLNASGQSVDQAGWSSDHGENVSFMRYPNGGPENMDFYQYAGFDDESSIGFSEGYPTRRGPNRNESPGLKVIGAFARESGGYVNIYWTNPIWLVTFDQAILRKSLTGFPQTPFEGEILTEGREQEYLYDAVAPGQTAYYTIFARTSCGDYSIPDSESQVSITMPMGVVDEGPLPQKAALLECYPNPFNASVTIKFKAEQSSTMELAIYNIAGQRVAELTKGLVLSGEHSMVWNAADAPSGIYFAKLESAGQRSLVKLTLLK
jgi:hypothetical protein